MNLGKPGNKKKNENNQPHCFAYHSQTTIPRLGHLKTPIFGLYFFAHFLDSAISIIVLTMTGFRAKKKRTQKWSRDIGQFRRPILDHGDLDGVDGYFAVLLWQEYKRSGNKKALETLLAYNIEDVVNLEILMVEAYNLNLEKTPFYDSHRLSYPTSPNVPFTAELKVIDKIKRAYWI